jgi:hypothetical protein
VDRMAEEAKKNYGRGLDMAILRAAHNAVRAAGASPAMNETSVHVVITDARRSDPACASSVVNVPPGAGPGRFRAAAFSECCSFVNRPARSPVCGSWLPNPYRMGEGRVRRADSSVGVLEPPE